VELEPGFALGAAPRFHVRPAWAERLRVNGGIERVGARCHPRPDWRPLTPGEMTLLVDEAPPAADPPRADLLAIPARLQAAWWDQAGQSSYERFAGDLLEFLRFKDLSLPAMCEVEVAVSRPGQVGTRPGPEIGSLGGLAAPAAASAPVVVAINLGDEPTHIVLVNLSPPALVGLVGAAGDAAPLPLADLAGRFFEARPAYPLLRIRLDPREGLAFPAGGAIFDGWTCDKREPDVVLSIRSATAGTPSVADPPQGNRRDPGDAVG